MKNELIRILLVEDDPIDVLLVKKILEKTESCRVKIQEVSYLSEALKQLKNQEWDIVLLDLFLPDCEAIQTVREVRAHSSEIPIIVLTSLDDESAALETLTHGAQDYLVKGELNGPFFIRTIRHAIERQRIRIQLDKTNAQLEKLALVDPLTGLLNRRGLQQILSGQILRSSRELDLLALLIDLDDFKAVNDTWGHSAGDVVLSEITNRLKGALRSTDHASRIGGDEFVLLLPETRMAEGVRVAEKVRLAISGAPVMLSAARPVKITASIGLVPVPPNTASIDELLVATHAALKKSKDAGKNQVSYDAQQKGELSRIHGQLLEGEFRAMQFPIFELDTMKKIGHEFLSRSNIPQFEMPDDFFRLSVEKNVLTLVDHRCFQTCANAAASEGERSQRCHFNLFPSTLIDNSIDRVLSYLPPELEKSQICIEISEQQIIGDPSYLLKSVQKLKEAGILVAIDDVGFGRSCFESLILLEPDILKIDKGCISGVSKDPSRVRSLKRILNVARVLETTVIAEGIESKEDLDVLIELGVKFGQGFFLEPPVHCTDWTSEKGKALSQRAAARTAGASRAAKTVAIGKDGSKP